MSDNETPPESGEITPKEFLVQESNNDGPGGLMGTMADLPPIHEITDVPTDVPFLGGLPNIGELPAPSDLTPSQLPNFEESSLPIPDELTDPNLSVDDMLSAAIAGELGDPSIQPEAALAAPLAPTFQVYFPALDDASRLRLKKVMESQKLELAEKTFSAPAPVVSQLNEYQAIYLLQAARALGIEGRGGVDCPLPAPTEEDLALGDLLALPEPEAAKQVEAAPSVVLPKGEKDVLLCTPSELPGAAVRETFGIVLAHRSIARRLFREEDMREKLEKELKTVPNRPGTPLPNSHFQVLLRSLLLELRKAALAKGANSVLGVKIEAFPESSSTDPQLEQLRLVAFGTAAVVEKS